MGLLDAKRLAVEDFGEHHAIGNVKRLHRLHPHRDDWRDWNKRMCLQCLGLPSTTVTTRDGHACGGTIDWLIVGQAEAGGYLLVTDEERGPEFKGVSLKATLTVSLAAARRVLHARTA